MKKKLSLSFYSVFFIFLMNSLTAQDLAVNSSQTNNDKSQKIIYFNPEIFPAYEEIREATNNAFFSAVSDIFSNFKNSNMLRVDSPILYEKVDENSIKEFCENNDAKFAVVPKVKFFKVGIGNYVLSSQVVVSMKLYDNEGHFIAETSYDTLKRNARILGSAENSIKIGTNGALKNLVKDYKALKRPSRN